MLIDEPSSMALSAVHRLSNALSVYADHPEQGMLAFKESLPPLRQKAYDLVQNTLFFSQLELLQRTITVVLSTGCVFDPELHQALFEVVDAFEQVLLSAALGGDYVEQTLYLLDPQRTCWQVLNAILSYQTFYPVFSYHGTLPALLDAPLDRLLDDLSHVGDLAFLLPKKRRDNAVDGVARGACVELKTAQPLAWLEARYPSISWRKTQDQMDPSPRLTAPVGLTSSLPALMLSTLLPRKVRYAMVDELTSWGEEALYRAFAECFSPKGFTGEIQRAARKVPVMEGFQDITLDNPALSAIPVRAAGGFFAYFEYTSALSAKALLVSAFNEEEQKPSRPVYLGRDVLACSLYVVHTLMGSYAFEKYDSVGCYTLAREAFFQTDVNSDEWWCAFGAERVALVASWGQPETGQRYVFHSDDLRSQNNVLIISQCGQLYAVLHSGMTVSEGVCGYSARVHHAIKNVWFTLQGDTLFEPWLSLESESITDTFFIGSEAAPMKAQKMGFYCAQMGDVSLWLNAELVLDVLACDVAHYIGPCLLYGVEYFHCFVRGGDKKQFSILVNALGGVVLECEACVWQRELPVASRDVNDSIVWHKELDGSVSISAPNSHADMVIDKDNITRFFGQFWPIVS